MAVANQEASSLDAGLDALELAQSSRPAWYRGLVRPVLARLAALVAVVAIWQVVVLLHLKPDYVLPSPGDVFTSFSEQWREGHLLEAIVNSLRRAFIGYAAALAFGTLVGLVVARVELLRLSIGSLLSALQSLPSVTWVPVGILWFGLTDNTIFFVVIMGAFPSIANGIIAALDNIPLILLKAGRSMGARGPSLYRHVIVPAALPGYIAGMKQAWSFSWRSLMAAELIAFSPQLGLSLGQLLDTGRSLSDMSLVLLSILAILVVGVAIDELLFSPLDSGIRRRRGLLGDA